MDETNQKQYNTYVELFKHYSSMIFRARVSIITVIVLSYWYIFGFAPHKDGEDITEMTKVLMPIFSSCLVTFLFLLEVSYDKLAFRAIKCLRILENEMPVSFFKMYERKHWEFNILYFIACIIFSAISLFSLFALSKPLPLFYTIIAWIGIVVLPILLFRFWMLLNKAYYKIIWELSISERGAFIVSIKGMIKAEDMKKYQIPNH